MYGATCGAVVIAVIGESDRGTCHEKDCRDLDEDCNDVVDKVACWLYDPARGMCPFLRKEND